MYAEYTRPQLICIITLKTVVFYKLVNYQKETFDQINILL